ncbi:Hpt domain-containing protein [Bradyrhizobium sp. CCGUVB1N3]|uniref:Hpt domain-containing protein n=1 Tax=Bradyrhizobium sp. CCGUVB1N3 TaxID=2949629 RepID=UPI0020B3E214|nr:Hpt domain-containing protein [Bradyrhizobium sp. CCGUVB1N3]MCP3474784.1 Hpt domain-containing protein [Bradyrhizobium sp. CCGUVB1N3]
MREAAARSSFESSLAAEPARDPGAFQALVREIGEHGAGEVRAVFWSETDARLKLFGDLALAQQRARIEREAHSLKSAARTFGYQRLAALAQQLERNAAALDDVAYRKLLDAMTKAYAAARDEDA